MGATPTMCLTENLEGVTEIRPGNYIFFDQFQNSLGSCSADQIVVSVLTTVIGAYPQHNTLLVDAGALAMSKDPGATRPENPGYGVVKGHPQLKLSSLSQEHGKITSDRPIDFQNLSIGTRLRIVPNHSCVTAALFDRYHVVENSRVVAEWEPVRGW